MNTVHIVVLALVRHDNKYLLTLRNDPASRMHGKWQIPGGGHEFGETTEETLHREVREELGVEIINVKLIPSLETKVRGNWQGVFVSYICEMKNLEAEIVLNEEATEYKWFAVDEIKSLDALAGCHEIVVQAEIVLT